MRKLSIFSISIFFLTIFFLQAPFIFNQQIFAVACHCVPHTHGFGGAYGNAFECDNGSYGACNHDEEKCVADSNAVVSGDMVKHYAITNRGTDSTLKGVSCKTTITCSCTNNNKGISCTSSQNPKYHENKPKECSDNSKVCVQADSSMTTDNATLGHDVGNGQHVTGIDCQPINTCQHSGSTGNNNNWAYRNNNPKDVDQSFCQHKEQACIDNKIPSSSPLYNSAYQNLPDGYAFCKSDITCRCSLDKSKVVCNSATSSSQQVICEKNTKCMEGSNLKVTGPFDQTTYGAACQDKTPPPVPPAPPCNSFDANGECISILSSVGNVNTDPPGFIAKLFGILLGISGAIAVLMFSRGGYRIMTSRGNPEAVKEGREQIIAAIVGLMFLIFSFVILQVIGVDLLQLPNFSSSPTSNPKIKIGPGKACNKNGGTCTPKQACGGSSGRSIGKSDCGDYVCCLNFN